jgi:molybdenum cofactor cytidylyltransferase
MKDDRMASIVLAAGYSSRMNSFKPFLEFGGCTAVETVVKRIKTRE